MSTWAAVGSAAGRRSHRSARADELRAASPAVRLATFVALAAFASVHYATLLLHPPAARVLGVVAVVAAGGAALLGIGRLSAARASSVTKRRSTGAGGARTTARAALAMIVLLATFALGLLLVGVPAHLLAPGRWPSLAHDLAGGYRALAGWLWPYRGGDPWARLTVLAVLPTALAAAAAICFWPSPRGASLRNLLALALLIALFLTGAANEHEPAWAVQGAVLIALIAAWLWLPTLRAGDLNRAARWLACCSLLALALAPLLGSGGAWIDDRSWNPVALTATFRWDETFGPIPWSRSEATMLEVVESRPAPLRVTSLDRFDGERFVRSPAPPGSAALDVPQTAKASWFTTATVSIGELRSRMIAGAGGPPLAVRWLSGGGGRVATQTDLTATSDQAPGEDARYAVESYAPAPGDAALRRAPRAYPAAYVAYTRVELPRASAAAHASVVQAPAPGRAPASDPHLARLLASSPYAPVFSLARRLAAGSPTPYAIALRIERYLRTHDTYDEHVPYERYPLRAFLFDQRRGYCQQFSGAMALMLRFDGVPARIAAGFTPGVFDPATGRWRVRALDAHTWVEVYFASIGWVAFDPTPPRSSPQPALVPAAGAPSRPASEPATGRSAAKVSHAHVRRVGDAAGGGDALPVAWLFAVAGALLALALAAAWLAGARRLRRAFSGAGGGAVAELRWALERMRGPLPARITLAQLRAELAHDAGACRYLEQLQALRYGERRAPRPGARERARLRRALARGGGPLGRVHALLALPPCAARARALRPR